MMLSSSRSRLLAACISSAALLFCCIPTLAIAQDSFQVEHFEPLPSQGTNILNIGKADMLGHLTPSAGLFVHYVNDPLALVNTDDSADVNRVVANQLKTEVWGSIGLFDIGELGFVLPVVAFQNGDDLAALGRTGSIDSFALQDARIIPKVRILNPEKFKGFGLALVAPVHIPIGDSDSFNSDSKVRVEPRLVADWRHPVGLAVAINAGYQLRPEAQNQNIAMDDVLRLGLGVEAPTGVDFMKVVASVFGNVQTEDDLGDIENLSSPAEALGGLQFSLPANLVANVGAGAGLTKGVGSPDFRVFASLGYTPMGKGGPGDTDGDGLLDPDDKCPTQPEDKDSFEDDDGCPDLDNDNDTILDVDDKCPLEPEDIDTFEDEDGCPDPDNDGDEILDVDDKCPLTPGVPVKQGCPFGDRDNDGMIDEQDSCPDEPEDKDNFEDDDGCPDPDNDEDGILDTKDSCPLEPELINGVEDDDGCPEKDTDNDGIIDPVDQCPTEPETYNGKDDEDGCPDGTATVEITKTEIKILQKVFFDTNKATIKKKSYTLLDTVATVLEQNPQVTSIRVEGHTDDMGKDAYNLDLSKRRAAAVKDYLIRKNIDPSRLESEGYGEESPLCKDIPAKKLGKRSKDRKLKACRADNRRVEFKILTINNKKVSSQVIEQE